MREKRSVDTTMAFTPLGGVVMSTRSGDLDPGVMTYLARPEQLSADQLEQLLSHDAGLLGISGSTGDLRLLLEREASDDACRLAVAGVCLRNQESRGFSRAVLGGIDALVFSGGIGEHAAVIRARICDGLDHLGIRIDEAANRIHATVISSSASRVNVLVIPTDEELMIARAALSLACSRSRMTTSSDVLARMDAYWRAANYLSVGQIYLLDNPLLRKPLAPEHIKPRLLGHWGTTPGQNFIYVHLNRIINEHDLNMIYISGPGHGGPALVANTYLEGTYSEIYPDVTQDEEGLKRLFRQFSFPGRHPESRCARNARAAFTKAANLATRSATHSARCSTIPI